MTDSIPLSLSVFNWSIAAKFSQWHAFSLMAESQAYLPISLAGSGSPRLDI
jgi:hypothetical protein